MAQGAAGAEQASASCRPWSILCLQLHVSISVGGSVVLQQSSKVHRMLCPANLTLGTLLELASNARTGKLQSF